MKKFLVMLLVGISISVAWIVPAHAVVKEFKNSVTSQYNVRVWSGQGCKSSTGAFTHRELEPGDTLKNWVRSYRIYSSYARVKYEPQNVYFDRTPGTCYNSDHTGRIVAYAKD